MKQEEWKEWHEMVKQEIKHNFPKAELEKSYDFGQKMEWGHLENYRVDASVKTKEQLVIFEVETYYNQEKIMRFIVFSSYVGADSLVLIFSDQSDVWDGKTRVKATEHLGEILNPLLTHPVKVIAFYANSASELEPKLLGLDLI